MVYTNIWYVVVVRNAAIILQSEVLQLPASSAPSVARFYGSGLWEEPETPAEVLPPSVNEHWGKTMVSVPPTFMVPKDASHLHEH